MNNSFTALVTGIDKATAAQAVRSVETMLSRHNALAISTDHGPKPPNPVTEPPMQLLMLAMWCMHQTGQEITIPGLRDRVSIDRQNCERILSRKLTAGARLLKPGPKGLLPTPRGEQILQAWFNQIFQGNIMQVRPRRQDLITGLRRTQGVLVVDRPLRRLAMPYDMATLILLLAWVRKQYGRPADVPFIATQLRCKPHEVYTTLSTLRQQRSSVLQIGGTNQRNLQVTATRGGLELAERYINNLLT